MVAASRVQTPERHLNRGIYDVVEVAALTHQPRARIERWVRQDDLILHGTPEFEGYFSFLDLISLVTVGELRSRGVPEPVIARGRSYLVEALETPWPFAHERLATVGRHFFAEIDSDDGWIDVGLGGQRAFDELVADELRLIEYGDDELAIRWRPANGIVIDPAVQAGAPCVSGSRVPTSLVQELVDRGEPLDQLADDYQLHLSQIVAAVNFEKSLGAAA